MIDYYHETLLQSPEAQAYLTKRGLTSSEAIARFRLGYANRTLGYRLPAKTRMEGAALRGQLQRIGILRPSGHEHLSGSLVVPVFGAAGEVTDAYGRKIQDHLREGTPLHLYLPGPHRGVWNVEALQARSRSCTSTRGRFRPCCTTASPSATSRSRATTSMIDQEVESFVSRQKERLAMPPSATRQE